VAIKFTFATPSRINLTVTSGGDRRHLGDRLLAGG
jgi:hypothetical protein